MVDTRLLFQLEAQGLTTAHLETLLHLLECGQNGSWTWHIKDGRLTHCDLRLVCASKAYELTQVSTLLYAIED